MFKEDIKINMVIKRFFSKRSHYYVSVYVLVEVNFTGVLVFVAVSSITSEVRMIDSEIL